jgi:hypothetical protein
MLWWPQPAVGGVGCAVGASCLNRRGCQPCCATTNSAGTTQNWIKQTTQVAAATTVYEGYPPNHFLCSHHTCKLIGFDVSVRGGLNCPTENPATQLILRMWMSPAKTCILHVEKHTHCSASIHWSTFALQSIAHTTHRCRAIYTPRQTSRRLAPQTYIHTPIAYYFAAATRQSTQLGARAQTAPTRHTHPCMLLPARPKGSNGMF